MVMSNILGYNSTMAKGVSRSLLLPVLIINSAVLALLVLLCQGKSTTKPVAQRLPRVAGSKVIALTGQTVTLSGSGEVSAAGDLRIEGVGQVAVTANSEVTVFNGRVIRTGQIVAEATPGSFVIEGSDLFAEINGTPLAITVSGYGTLSPDIVVTAEVTN